MSGNPRGRPLGTHQIGKLRAELAKHVPDILASLATAAKQGDVSASKLILERVIPALRPEELPVSLEGFAGNRTELIAAVIAAIADGKLDMSRGGRFIFALTPQEIEEKLAKLERMIEERNDEHLDKGAL